MGEASPVAKRSPVKRVLGCGATGFFLGLVFLAILAGAVWVHSGLVAREIRVDAAWSALERIYQRRADLVPLVADSLRGSPGADAETLETLGRARDEAVAIIPTPELLTEPGRFERFVRAQERLDAAFRDARESPGGALAPGFSELEAQLEATDRELAAERRRFETAVAEYNRAIDRFPGSLVARLAGFEARATFPGL